MLPEILNIPVKSPLSSESPEKKIILRIQKAIYVLSTEAFTAAIYVLSTEAFTAAIYELSIEAFTAISLPVCLPKDSKISSGCLPLLFHTFVIFYLEL